MKNYLQFEAVTAKEATNGKRRSALMDSITAFLNSDDEAWRVAWRGYYVTGASCASALRKASKTLRCYNQLLIVIRGEFVALIKKSALTER